MATALLVMILGAPFAAAAAGDDASSLYSAAGPRPGPSILYQPPAISPQLTNAPGGVWQAQPILVSGSSAYRSANTCTRTSSMTTTGRTEACATSTTGAPAATPSPCPTAPNYPSGPGYNGNAAEIVEVRVRPLSNATAFRVTLNTRVSPALAAFTIAISTPASATAQYPHGAQSSGPADRFVTVHNTYANLITAGGITATSLPAATVDTTRRQVEVRVPHALWNPGMGEEEFGGEDVPVVLEPQETRKPTTIRPTSKLLPRHGRGPGITAPQIVLSSVDCPLCRIVPPA